MSRPISKGTWVGVALVLLLATLVTIVLGKRRGEAPGGAGVEERSSIVLIVIDTLRSDALGVYGHPLDTSPELDALARRGILFTDALSQSSWTRPSFASMLTSLPPRASGIAIEKEHALPEAFVTLPEALDDAGYVTVGLTANPNINSTFHFDQGFDEYVDSSARFPWMDAEADEGDERDGRVPFMSAEVALERTLEAIDSHAVPDRPVPRSRPVPRRPVYVQVDLMDVHEYDDRRVVTAPHRDSFPGHPDNEYLSAIRQVSSEIHAFIAALETRPAFARKTLYVITSDHGEGLHSHPRLARGQGHGYYVYESQVRVPLILYHSGGALPAGREVEEPVQLMDLMPTLLDLARVEGPKLMLGRSLLPLINGEPLAMPDGRVVETRFRRTHTIGVYDGEFLYVEHRRPWDGIDRRELQALGELAEGAATNRIEEHPERARDLEAFLERWEREHPEAPPTTMGRAIPRRELEQLRALGYIE